jgi:hypothetical protein
MQVHLDLDVDAEPVSGNVRLIDAEPHDFTGYASLIATLQSLRAQAAASRPVPMTDGAS